MPVTCDDFAADELAMALGESRGRADHLLTMAHHLETRLPAKAGLEGGMDELRARAYLDLLLGKDSRPRQDDPRQDDPGRAARPGSAGPPGPAPAPRAPGPQPGPAARSRRR